MLTLAEIIRAPKKGVLVSDWKNGKIPNVAFPLAKGTRGFPVGPGWLWRLCQFEALGLPCRVLIRLNEPKARYHAVLGIEVNGAFRVICHHELHIPDKGWHCHFAIGNILEIFPGVLRDRTRTRVWEAKPSEASQVAFTVDKANGLMHAATMYRFSAQGDLI